MCLPGLIWHPKFPGSSRQPVRTCHEFQSASVGYNGSENGFQSDKSFKTGHTFSNNGETWIEVSRACNAIFPCGRRSSGRRLAGVLSHNALT